MDRDKNEYTLDRALHAWSVYIDCLFLNAKSSHLPLIFFCFTFTLSLFYLLGTIAIIALVHMHNLILFYSTISSFFPTSRTVSVLYNHRNQEECKIKSQLD